MAADRDHGAVSVAPEVDFSAVETVLHHVGRDVRRAMLDAIPDGEPHGFLYGPVRDYPTRPGKAIRPALCLAACRAFGGTTSDAMPLAVSIELLHNAFLVHDDIADGSAQRRGRPTLPEQFGMALALNAGDALAVVANQVLRRHLRNVDRDLAERVHTEFDTMAMRTLEGQATELGWRHERTVGLTPEDYLDLIMHKTCWYTTIHPLRVGALVGGRGRVDLRPMVRFGFHLGAAFQIQDVVLNLVGDEGEYGKEINGDLFEGKRTLPLIHVMQHAQGAAARTVAAYLGMSRDERSPEIVAEIRDLMDRYDSIAFTLDYARGIAREADTAFAAAFAAAPPSDDRDFVRDLVPYMLGRRS
jgi:geranylgeranyl diphosphate synthase type II